MDLRIQRTKAAIKEAFIELRKSKPIEKITVTELTKLANINKATFYLHYSDIFMLSDEIEDSVIDEILLNLKVLDRFFDNPQANATEILKAILSHSDQLKQMFSGSRSQQYSIKIENRIRAMLLQNYPQFDTKRNNVILTFIIQGCFHSAFKISDDLANNAEEVDEIARLLTKMVSELKPAE